jgi:hypothetical protein
MSALWLFPLLTVSSALVVTGLATCALRRSTADLGTALDGLGEARRRLEGLAAAAAELGDSGHPPPRR